MTRATRGALLAIVLAALAGLGLLLVCAPSYLTRLGFPLDDAWIHAVYGRSLARSGMLAYNPGIPATGATSPLWAVLLAIPQLLGTRVRAVVLLTKLLGFALHVLTALVAFAAFGTDASPSAERPSGQSTETLRPVGGWLSTLWAGATWPTTVRACAAVLVAFHPDLISASVSGMEISLAALVACSILYMARCGSLIGYAALCVVAPLARPELASLCYLLPLVLFWRRDHRRLLALGGAAVLGNGVAFGGMALRNLAISGLPLPATFYAKAGAGGLPIPLAEFVGFSQLLGHIAVADSSVLLALLAGVAMWLVLAGPVDADRGAAAALLGGLAFCGISFALVRPIDPRALYHQRYVLPVIPLIVAAVPILAAEALRRWFSLRTAGIGVVVLLTLCAASLLIEAPIRYERLANDARNIDDVQVAVGQTLAHAPPTAVVWAVDAGAIRYFGNAFVVDMMGLNNAQMLGSHAQTFLDRHRPRYIEIVPTWSSLDRRAAAQLESRLFAPSTEYTVTSFPAMQRHWLVRCPPTFAGELRFRGRRFHFSCAPAGGRVAPTP